jgi:hypothetical protein
VPSQTLGLVVPYSPEYRTIGPNLPLLTRLAEGTDGRLQVDPTRIFRDAPSWVVGKIDYAPLLLSLCALLFLADIAVRRLAFRPQQVKEAAVRGVEAAGGKLADYRRSRLPVTESAPQMARLLERKTALRGPVVDEPVRSTDRLLGRRAASRVVDDDNPFPNVASLQRRPPPTGQSGPGPARPPAPTGTAGYTSRLLDAKRRARDPDDV